MVLYPPHSYSWMYPGQLPDQFLFSQFDNIHVLRKPEDFPLGLLPDLLDQESVIFIKGSRMMNMEEYIDLLKNNL